VVARLNIVVVEDHDALREITEEVLREQGHHVVGLACAEAMGDEVGCGPIDLLIVDLNLPGEDGLSLARRFRAGQPRAGIIIVSARNLVADKISGYESGADIFLPKPVAPDELMAAVNALARRICVQKTTDLTVSPQFLLDTEQMHLDGPAGRVKLTDTESSILTTLTRAAGQRLEVWQILELLNLAMDASSKASLEVRIVRLRKKLIEVGADKFCIRSVRLFGYQLCLPLKII
jgi:DNA-binding response OmpR family regulator